MLYIIIPVLVIVLLLIGNRQIEKKKEEEEKSHLKKLQSAGLSKSDIIYIGYYVGGEYKLPFSSECFIQDGYIKFTDIKNSPNYRFNIALIDITFVWTGWYFELLKIVSQEEIKWRKKELKMGNVLLITSLDNERVINTVFEIAPEVDHNKIYDRIQEQVELEFKKKSDEFWSKQPKEIQKKRIRFSHETINLNGDDQYSFVAIDFEHATPTKGTVCSVGIVTVENGEITDQYATLIQPPNNEYFPSNSLVHGIFETDTINSPSFKEIWPEIKRRINNKTVIAHGASHTDQHCLEEAMEMNDIHENINIHWIDTQNICNARLDIISDVCNIDLKHHDALSDTIACAKMYLMYLKGTLPIDKILKNKEENSKARIFRGEREKLTGDVLIPDFSSVIHTDNPFFKKKVVISGIYEQWPDRKELAFVLKELGADIDTNIGKYTNILCAGKGCGPSKLKKMQELIDAGKDAQILKEEEIIKLIQESGFSEQ